MHTSTRSTAGAICVLTITSVVGVVQAQAPSESFADRDRQARIAFESGRDAFEDQNYDTAIEDFERAFQLSGRPVLLINIARAHQALNRKGAAAAALTQYLVLRPAAPNRAELEAELLTLGAVAEPEPAPAEPGPFDGRVLTWVLAGTGVALAAASVGLHLHANSEHDELQQSCGGEGCSDGELQNLEDSILASQLLLSGAVIAFAGAVAAYFLEAPVEQDDFSVVVGAGGAGVRGQF